MKTDLRQYRQRAGLSQADLGETIGVSRQTINAIERERSVPSLQLAFELANHFDCAVADMFEPEKQNVTN